MDSNIIAPLAGAGICCVVPLAMFALGYLYARHGLPLTVHWRGFAGEVADE